MSSRDQSSESRPRELRATEQLSAADLVEAGLAAIDANNSGARMRSSASTATPRSEAARAPIANGARARTAVRSTASRFP